MSLREGSRGNLVEVVRQVQDFPLWVGAGERHVDAALPVQRLGQGGGMARRGPEQAWLRGLELQLAKQRLAPVHEETCKAAHTTGLIKDVEQTHGYMEKPKNYLTIPEQDWIDQVTPHIDQFGDRLHGAIRQPDCERELFKSASWGPRPAEPLAADVPTGQHWPHSWG